MVCKILWQIQRHEVFLKKSSARICLKYGAVLDGDEKRKIMEAFSIKTFNRNQIIYAEKDSPKYLWCLLKGKVKLFKDGIGGRPQILRLIRPVQYFGYRAYFANEPYVSSAAAFEQSTIGCLPMSLVCELTQNNIKPCVVFYT